MKQATTATMARIEQTSQILFWGFVAAIVLCASMYMFFVNKTVWNVVARQEAESKIVSLNSKVSTMEFQYITAKANVTMELAKSLGYQPVQGREIFVTKIDTTKSVALR